MMSNNSLGSDQSNNSRSQGSDRFLSLLTKRFNEWDTLQNQLPLNNDFDRLELQSIEFQLNYLKTNQPAKIRNNEDNNNNVYLDKLSRWKPTIVSPNPPSAILLERNGTIHSSLTEESSSSQYKPSSTPPTLSAAHHSKSPTTNQTTDASVALFGAVPPNNRHVDLPLTKFSHVPPTQHTTMTVVTVEDQQVR